MKTYLLLVATFLSCLQYAAAQKENNNWCFGYHAGISFNTVPPQAVPSNMYAQYVTATVSDANGNLLFYTSGGTVWDRNNNIMPNGDTIIPTNPAFPFISIPFAAEILPDPGNSNRYYVFSISQDYYYPVNIDTGQLRYSIVDMTLNNGMGDVVPGYKNILLDSVLCPIVATAGNGFCNKWIVTHEIQSNKFHSFLITPSGINAPVISSSGIVIPHMTFQGQMKISSDDKKLAIDYIDDDLVHSYVELFDFDVNTGQISNAMTVDTLSDSTSAEGIEFSPDGTKLYFLHSPDSLGILGYVGIYQEDISMPTASAIRASKNLVGLADGSDNLQLGPDNKIYFNSATIAQPASFGAINNPNVYGLSCNVVGGIFAVSDSVNLIDGLCSRIPPTPATGASISNNISACNLPDTISAQASAAGYVWSTGGNTQSIIINQPGTYWVKTTQSCGALLVDTFHVTAPPPYNPVGDTFSCNGPVTIQGNAAYNNLWSDGTTGPTFSVSKGGTFSVIASSGQCVYNNTFQVYIYPPANTPILPADTTICNGTTAITIAPYYSLGNYQWSTGDTGNNISINTAGTYWLTSATPCGVFSDTMHVSFCAPVIDKITATTDTLCSGQCILFTAQVSNNPQTYQWNFRGGTPASFTGATPPAICYDSTGTYTISLSVANTNGTDSATTHITVLPKPVSAFADTSITVAYNATLVMPPCNTAARIQWYYNNALVCASCNSYTLAATDNQGTYTCIISNGNCSDSCNYNITVSNIPEDVFLPNAFTPNGDGLNDYFHAVTTNPNIEVLLISVYDRWGARVFSGSGSNARWDGNYGGVPVDIGTYFWALQYTISGNPAIFYKKGDVTVVR